MSGQTNIRSVSALLFGATFLFMGSGIYGILIPLRAQAEGYSVTLIGIMAASYFGGYLAGCFSGPRLIGQVGHIRCFAGFSALATACALGHAFIVSPEAWIPLRFLMGVAISTLYMVTESWLNEKSSNDTRGTVIGIYLVLSTVGMIAGQGLLNLYDVRDFALFALIGLVICIGMVPLVLTRVESPQPVAEASFHPRALFRMSPAALLGCLVFGLVEGSFWSLAPVYATARGFSVSDTTLLIAVFMGGGLLSQWPVGRFSDTVDRRYVMAGIALCSLLSSFALTLPMFQSREQILVLTFLYGLSIIPLYCVSIAHANDFAPPEKAIETASGLLLTFAIGAVIGPLLNAPLMERFGAGALFMSATVILAVFGVIVLARSLGRNPKEDDRVDYALMPHTSAEVIAWEYDNPEDEEPAEAADPA